MPRMIELMRQSAVPANVMRSAAKGALALPAPEMIEILVFLTASPIFGEQARMTMAGWDEKACLEAASDSHTPREVLDYMTAPENRRPKLVPALLENPAVPESALMAMAQEQSRELVDMMLESPRVQSSLNILHALAGNPHLAPEELQQTQTALAKLGEAPAPAAQASEDDGSIAQFLQEHAAEIAAEEGKAFKLVGENEDEKQATQSPAAPAEAAAPAAPAAVPAAKAAPEERERISTVQKISRLKVGDRVQLAMKGTKDERFVLIRDGSKVVSSAVLESPKLSDQEVEMFASMKNVQESVLRGIAGKRKLMKNYAVVRALCNNPRCPLDIQLTLAKNLLNPDLRNLSMNKNVSETVRKMALKLFKERTEKKGGGGE